MVLALGLILAATRAGFCRVDSMGSPFILQLFKALGPNDLRFWRGWGINGKLFCILGVQFLPTELHRLATDDAADGSSTEQAIQNIETNVPPGCTHRDVAAINVVPQREARAAIKGFEFPSDVEATPLVLKSLGRFGSRHGCFGNV